MELIVKFKNGENVTLEDWDNWSKDYAGKNDIIELFTHYKEIDKELTFNNPETGFNVKRDARDVKSIEIVFD